MSKSEDQMADLARRYRETNIVDDAIPEPIYIVTAPPPTYIPDTGTLPIVKDRLRIYIYATIAWIIALILVAANIGGYIHG